MIARKFMAYGAVGLLGLTLVAGCGSSGSSTAKVSSAASSGDFGTMKKVCHPATGKASGSPDRGVTASTIRVTTISDAGSSLQPGLNQELWDAATVFTRWCNDNGGINGRRILMTKGDAQVLNYKQTIDQACDNSFALVGGGGAFDNTGQEDRVKCLLPAVPGFVASAQARGAPLSYPALAASVLHMLVGDQIYLRDTYGSNQKIASVYGDFETTQFTSDQAMTAAKEIQPPLAGSDSPVNDEAARTYPPTGQSDWRETARSVDDSKATGLLFSGQPSDLGNLLTALAARGSTSLKWASSFANMYDQNLIESARAALSQIPLYVELFTFPFEDAGNGTKSQAIDEFLKLFEKYLPTGKSHAMLAVSGFASWLLFAQSASACGSQLTRKCLVAQLAKTHSFDAGGLIAPRDPSNSDNVSKCFVVMKATPKGFVRVEDKNLKPSKDHWPFTCDEAAIHTFNSGTEPMRGWLDKLQWSDAAKAKIVASLP